MKKVLIFAGGWDGHKPGQFADILSKALGDNEFAVEVAFDLSVLDNVDTLKAFDLISPFWTMGKLTPEQSTNLQQAVRSGVGLGGIHGGMGDAFRGDLDYEWMVGGHFVGHPVVGNYTVRVLEPAHPTMSGIPATFEYDSEQYYMMVDPGIHVLAETDYEYENRTVKMPVAWTKTWGKGRVFYSALGHTPEEFDAVPAALTLAVQGMIWAAR